MRRIYDHAAPQDETRHRGANRIERLKQRLITTTTERRLGAVLTSSRLGAAPEGGRLFLLRQSKPLIGRRTCRQPLSISKVTHAVLIVE
jgi:hypothetical protein